LLRRQGKAALVATHDLDRLNEFDRVVTLRDGRAITNPTEAHAVPDQHIA
jgi:ABC-type transport system involved in cytochrome bd biosynthesis fused ATPase/permease subunit